MMYVVVGFACMAFGLYAGKKRAKGDEWFAILKCLVSDLVSFARAAWDKTAGIFSAERKEDL